MPSTKYSNPVLVGDNPSGANAALGDFNNPVLAGYIRVPVTGQNVVAVKLPSYAWLISSFLDVTTAWSTGNINVGTTSSGTELAAMLGTATGRAVPTLTAAQITASKATTLGAGQVTIYVGNASSTGAGVGEVVLHVGFANFQRVD